MFKDLLEAYVPVNRELPVSDKVPVFVMLSHTGTVLSNIIKKFTKNPYSHASISFDSSMTHMYSFGRKFKSNPLIGTFVKENITAGLYKDVEETSTFSLYVTFVTPEEREAMLDKIQELSDRNARKELKYNFIGLLYNKLGIAKERSDAYFCSEFVDTILESGKKFFNKHASLVRPYDFAKQRDFSFVLKGKLRNYSKSTVDARVAEMQNKLGVS